MQDSDDRQMYGSCNPGLPTGGAGHPNEGKRSSTGITMVPNLQAGDRLGYQSINFIKTPMPPRAARISHMVQWYNGQDDVCTNVSLPVIGGSMRTINPMSEIPMDPDGTPSESCANCPNPDIEILGASRFDNLIVCDETIETFALRNGECSGLLGATMEFTTLEGPGEIETINPKCWTSGQGATAVIAAEAEPHSGILE